MSYDDTIKTEAQYAKSLDSTATEDKFHATYNGILTHWFPTSQGYVTDYQVMGDGGKPEFIIVRHAGGKRNPVLIAELKRPAQWTTAGKKEVVNDLTTYTVGRFDLTQYNTIYGVGGIGLTWMACKMEKSGTPDPVVVQDWQDDISSDTSFTKFQTIAGLVYNITLPYICKHACSSVL
ncbi:hypothetical protein BJV74DRAFT_216244 [Russula compacta]|nr:hypothetical protein BJV74DRAFT_216244 [Russula compacta]